MASGAFAPPPPRQETPMPTETASAVLRPLLWVAAVAFMTGFGGYLAIGLSTTNAG